MTLTLFQDKRPILAIYSEREKNLQLTVGEAGITKIEVYEESGQMACVPWFAIYKGDWLVGRVDAFGLGVVYQEEK